MSFPSDGTNHYNAIKNEISTKEFLQEHAHKIFKVVEKGKYIVLSKGGTTNKADNIIKCDDENVIYISDKQKKKGLSIGSFDYTNTSVPIHDMLTEKSDIVEHIQTILNNVKKVKQLPIEERKKLVDSYRKPISNASYTTLTKLQSNDIINLIKNFLIKPNEKMEMFITDGATNERYTFSFTDHPIVKLIKSGFTPSINVKNGKSSGKIIFSKGTEKVDVGLRIRIHTNNGATALLNAGGSNKSSQFVLKFQQDGVAKLLTKMGISAIEI